MRSRTIFARLLALVLGTFLIGGSAAAADSAGPLAKRAGELVALFNGSARHGDMFSPQFLAQVPSAQLDAVSKQLVAQYGAARAVDRIAAKSATAGTVFVAFERATVQLELAVEPSPPHKIIGLLVSGAEMKGDSLAAVTKELQALPGQTGFAIASLGEATPAFAAGHRADQPMAIGSAFKLFILAELVRQVKAGERRWSDVVPLSHRSLPSGFLESWPEGAPMTLYALAGLMISQSDNSATDTLLHALGREKVEAIMPVLGVAAPERNRPFLATIEAFGLKALDEKEFGASWKGRSEAERRAMLGQRRFRAQEIDAAKFVGAPARIESVEWFASPQDLVRTMDWLRRNGDRQTLDVLAINPGIGPAAKAHFNYLGFKGGSETGVINLSFLVQSKNGAWHAVSGSWNNPAAAVDDNAFVALMSRAVSLLR